MRRNKTTNRSKRTKIESNKIEEPIQDQDGKRSLISIPSVLTVKEFAEALSLPVTQIIASLMKNGVIATINENIDVETAMIIGDELGFDIEEEKEIEPKIVETKTSTKKSANQISRPPVVTIMGHVDHGKTTLLDTIRRTNVVSTESGGITQHIGAYQVKLPVSDHNKAERLITFLDTPGHEAFSAMRAHGASITDIVVLVVAADDGVKPQTVEAINHSLSAGVPILVAINKIDVQGANPERVKKELADRDLVPEDWGGKTIMVPISAKKGENIEELLEMILLVADMRELKTDPSKPASAVVIESHMQAGVGPLATVLVNDGTLKQGDSVVVGQTYGKIRFMEDFRGRRIKEATASMPISVAGLQDVPQYGEPLVTVESEKIARQMTQVKSVIKHHIGIGEVSQAVAEGKTKEIKIILKTDVQGSLEAIRSSINQLASIDVKVKTIHEGVGDINESDVNMAAATGAIILGFKVSITPPVRQLSERLGIKITLYDIIYQLLDDLYAALSGLLEPEKVEVKIGKAEVLQIFRSTKESQIVGAKVTSGKLTRDCFLKKFVDDETEPLMINVKSLHRGQEEVDNAEEGQECGIGLEGPNKLEVGDKVESFQIEEKVRSLKH